jgi:serine/threonine protein kinase
MPSCDGTLQAPHCAVLTCVVSCCAVSPSQLSHHDLKPDNIGYDPSQRRFVLWDFGLASRFGQEPVGACYQYAAPEVGGVGWGGVSCTRDGCGVVWWIRRVSWVVEQPAV